MKNMIEKAYEEIEFFEDKLGELIVDCTMGDDTPSIYCAENALAVFDSCATEREEKVAEAMFIAICGMGLKSMIEKIKARDNEGFLWESV